MINDLTVNMLMLTAFVNLSAAIIKLWSDMNKNSAQITTEQSETPTSIALAKIDRRRKYDFFMSIAMMVIYSVMTVGLFFYALYGATTPVTFREAAFLVFIGTMVVTASRPLK
jgi:hypothetical protein